MSVLVKVRYVDPKSFQLRELSMSVKSGVSVGEVKNLVITKLSSDLLRNSRLKVFIDGRLASNEDMVRDDSRVLVIIERDLSDLLNEFINDLEISKYLIKACYVDSLNKVLNDIDKLQSELCITQVLPTELIISKYHILLASYYVFKAFREGSNISRKKHLEFLLYLLGDRQLSSVIKKLGSLRREGIDYVIINICKGPDEGTSELLSKYCVSYVNELSELIESTTYDLKLLNTVFGVSASSIEELRTMVVLRTIELYLRKH